MWPSACIFGAFAAEISFEKGDAGHDSPAPIGAETVVNAVVVADARFTLGNGPAEKQLNFFVVVSATVVNGFAFE